MCPAGFAERLPGADVDTASPRSEQVAPLVVGAADDRAEREADRVADEVIARLHGEGGEAHVHGAGCGHAGVRRAATSSAEAEVGFEGGELSADLSGRIESRRGSGSPLPDNVRRRLETGFGRSLADVRIHDDAESAALNQAVSARAFTTGRDIFFGAGEFQPHTPEGERVLAHEAAHVVQQATGAHRTAIRRWNFGAADLGLDRAKSVGVVSSGQTVYFLDDATGDRIVVKVEDKETGLAELSATVLESLGNVKSVRQRKLSAGETAAIKQTITSKGGPKLDQAAWAKLGKTMRADPGALDEINGFMGRPYDTPLDDMSDVEVAQKFHEAKIHSNGQMVAMTYGGKDTGIKATESKDPNQMNPQENRMRALLSDFKHLENLGQLTAVDLFLGNADRVLGGNIGNWIYDPYTAAVTAIDHVDSTVSLNFKSPATKAQFDQYLDELRSSKLRETADNCAKRLMYGLMDRGGDKGAMDWAKADGGWRMQMISEGIERGLVAGRALIVKTFSATRFSVGKSNKEARATKKAIKAAARDAETIDGADPESYYKMLKARAEWLKKN